MTRRPAPLASAADFQTAWILTLVLIAVTALACWGLYQVYRALRDMWRAGDALMVVTMVSLVTVTLIAFGAMLAMVVVSIGPNALGGGA